MIEQDKTLSSILIVDDKPENIQLIGTLLRKNYNLYVADNGESAVKIANDKLPDLILLDIMMPRVTGYDVCKTLKSNPLTKDIPVIFLTARNESEDIVKGFQLGAVDYITKPFKQEEVIIRISTHIKLKESERELIRKNSEIEKTAKKLEILNQEKDKFFSIIAHDLRNPISGFLGLTEMVGERVEKFSTDELKYYLNLMHKSADQLNILLANLLEWSRLQMGNVVFIPESNNLHIAVNKIISHLSGNLKEKNIKCENSIPSGITFVFDLYMLDTVLRNLIGNAIKFTRKEGSIIVSTEIKDSAVIISVKDSGIGIPPALAEKLFSIKEVVSRKGTDGETSSGLGLLLCKSFIEKNNGSIWFDTQVDIGTTFYISLPYVTE
jgi:two-component system, sensor histidine kinase and response regulator